MKLTILKKYSSYKDSEFEWLDIRPSSWAITRLKDLGWLQNGISKSAEYFGFGSPFVSYGNVYNDTINISKINTFANSSELDQKAYSVIKNDVFFTRTSETVDEIGFAATCTT
nr:hypothetical protein [Ignavibacteriaceae bacterium]